MGPGLGLLREALEFGFGAIEFLRHLVRDGDPGAIAHHLRWPPGVALRHPAAAVLSGRLVDVSSVRPDARAGIGGLGWFGTVGLSPSDPRAVTLTLTLRVLSAAQTDGVHTTWASWTAWTR